MKMERLKVVDWCWVMWWLMTHLEEMGDGLTREDVPLFKRLLEDPENWFVRGEHGPVKGLFVFLHGDTPKEFEVHASGNARGWRWIGLSRRVLRWFASEAGAVRVRTWVQAENVRSGLYVRACGMRKGRTTRMWLGRLGARLVRCFEWKGAL
jgi:hypothetical protein